MNGNVFNIQRFSIEDGPGIRTTVFLKGCPLRCAWCHNPESHKIRPEILFDNKKCVLCAACANVCPNHVLQSNQHFFERDKCISCGKCADACLLGALELCGKEMSDTEVIEAVLRDKAFYQNDGGMTLSGGEPLMQAEFSLSLLKLAKENGIHTAIETSGFGSQDAIRRICEYTDLFLFDIKLTDKELHIQYTGVSNDEIYKNLRLINSLGKKIILRCPIIPGVNLTDTHIQSIFSLSENLSSVASVEFEPYHPLGISKSILLGKSALYGSEEFLGKEKIKALIECINPACTKPYSIH